jgi:predicted NodU family carbamoyl transferase
MALTAEAKKSFPVSYQSVLHVDKSARIQILNDDTHLISNVLDNLSGEIDILINTSFNIAGDPIVFDFIDCFVNMKRMGLKFLLTDQGLYEM